MKFEVLTAVTVKLVCLDVLLCSMVDVYQHFRVAACITKNSGLNGQRSMIKDCTVYRMYSLRLWSHRIRIWPIFYTDVHGQQRQNKQMCLSKRRWSQWRRAALTCTDMLHQLMVETRSI